MFPVRFELGFYIAEDGLHSHRRENLKFSFEKSLNLKLYTK
jgi:hypothetical protein